MERNVTSNENGQFLALFSSNFYAVRCRAKLLGMEPHHDIISLANLRPPHAVPGPTRSTGDEQDRRMRKSGRWTHSTEHEPPKRTACLGAYQWCILVSGVVAQLFSSVTCHQRSAAMSVPWVRL